MDGKGYDLLLKMGYKPGAGLGRKEEGRTEPVQVEVRGKHSGLGYSVSESQHEQHRGTDKGKKKRKTPIHEASEQSSNESESGPPEFLSDISRSTHDHLDHTLSLLNSSIRKQQAKITALRDRMDRAVLLRRRLHELDNTLLPIDPLKTSMSILERSKRYKAKLTVHSFRDCWSALNDEMRLRILLSIAGGSVENMQELREEGVSDELIENFAIVKWLPGLASGASDALRAAEMLPAGRLRSYLVSSRVKPDFLHRLTTDTIQLSELEHYLKLFIDDKDVMSLTRRSLLSNFTKATDQRAFLARWASLLPPDQWLPFSISIGSVLSRSLRTVVVCPSNQDISVLSQVLATMSLLPEAVQEKTWRDGGMYGKLETCLRDWLEACDAEYGEIGEWYRAWRQLVPETVSFRPLLIPILRYIDAVFLP